MRALFPRGDGRGCRRRSALAPSSSSEKARSSGSTGGPLDASDGTADVSDDIEDDVWWLERGGHGAVNEDGGALPPEGVGRYGMRWTVCLRCPPGVDASAHGQPGNPKPGAMGSGAGHTQTA